MRPHAILDVSVRLKRSAARKQTFYERLRAIYGRPRNGEVPPGEQGEPLYKCMEASDSNKNAAWNHDKLAPQGDSATEVPRECMGITTGSINMG